MRILYLHQYYNSLDMPGGTRSAEMARRLAASGHEVHLITSRRDSRAGVPESGWSVTEEDGYFVHWGHVPYSNHMPDGTRIRAFLRFAWIAAGYAGRLGGDIVFATSTPLTIAIPGVWAAWRNRCPFVLEIRDLWPELPIVMGALPGRVSRSLARRLERWAYSNATAIVALSPGMRDGVVATGIPASRVTVIPNACDTQLHRAAVEGGRDLRERTPWLGDRPMILYAGTLGRINGVSYLIRMAAELKDPEIRVVIVGDGAEAANIRELASSAGVLGRTVFMLPSLPKREIVAWFAAATVSTSLFIDLPQMWANSANKFFDGLAAGKPIAINYRGWQAELLEESGAGLVLPPGDPAGAAARIEELIRAPGRLAQMGEASQRLATERFDRGRLAEELRVLLERAEAEGSAPRHPFLPC